MSSVDSIANLVVVFLFLVFWTVSFVVLYHLTRFGVGVVPKRFAALFLTGSVLLSCLCIALYQKVDLNALIP